MKREQVQLSLKDKIILNFVCSFTVDYMKRVRTETIICVANGYKYRHVEWFLWIDPELVAHMVKRYNKDWIKKFIKTGYSL